MVLKLMLRDWLSAKSFRSLQTYMVLKLMLRDWLSAKSFRPLQTYMVLKLLTCRAIVENVLDPYKLTWFSNLRRWRSRRF